MVQHDAAGDADNLEQQPLPGGLREKLKQAQLEDPALKAKQKRADLIKKQVLLKKIQAVRQGGGENIMASYEPSNWRKDKNMRINKLMDR